MGIQNIPLLYFGGPNPQTELPNSLELANGQNIDISSVGGSLVVSIIGTIPIANGGTNNPTLDVSLGGVLYVDGSAVQSTGPGPLGMVITSSGSGPPEWQQPFDSFIYSQGGA